METVTKNVNYCNNGSGSRVIKLNIPIRWAGEMGITNEDKRVLVTFDGKKITVEKAN